MQLGERRSGGRMARRVMDFMAMGWDAVDGECIQYGDPMERMMQWLISACGVPVMG